MTTHNDDGSIIEDLVLSQESGNYGVDIPKNVWHKLGSLESGSVIFGGDRGQVPVPSFISSKLHKMPLFQQKRGQAV